MYTRHFVHVYVHEYPCIRHVYNLQYCVIVLNNLVLNIDKTKLIFHRTRVKHKNK